MVAFNTSSENAPEEPHKKGDRETHPTEVVVSVLWVL